MDTGFVIAWNYFVDGPICWAADANGPKASAQVNAAGTGFALFSKHVIHCAEQ